MMPEQDPNRVLFDRKFDEILLENCPKSLEKSRKVCRNALEVLFVLLELSFNLSSKCLQKASQIDSLRYKVLYLIAIPRAKV